MDLKDCRQCRMAALEKDIITYFIFYITALITLVMLADGMIQCGEENTVIRAYQMAEYVPLAIFMPAAPFLNLLTYHETAPRKRKIIKYAIVIVLFTASLLVTMDAIMPQLISLYGTAQLVSFGYPMCFYLNAAIALAGEITGSGSTVKTA